MASPVVTRPCRQADAAPGGVRLSVSVRVGADAAEIAVEPGHLERIFRMTVCLAIRDGKLSPAEPVVARLVAGKVRERHGAVLCLDSCAVEIARDDGSRVARRQFPLATFAAFAAARAVHLLGDGTAAKSERTEQIGFALHATSADDDPLPVARPDLAVVSLTEMAAGAARQGAPDEVWLATFVTRAVARSVVEMDERSRTSGVEAAARIHTRVGFDPTRRCFVRTLERLVVTPVTRATALSVVSTAASWASVLEDGGVVGPRVLSSVHTHLHLARDAGPADGVAGTHLVAGAGLGAAGDPCISIEDIVTHYTTFPDPLSAALIVSLFPDRRVITLYGYTPGARLRVEPGYWILGGDT